MARRIMNTKYELEYTAENGGWNAWLQTHYTSGGKIIIDTCHGEMLDLTPAQARHIAKKLNQFADDIVKGK